LNFYLYLNKLTVYAPTRMHWEEDSGTGQYGQNTHNIRNNNSYKNL